MPYAPRYGSVRVVRVTGTGAIRRGILTHASLPCSLQENLAADSGKGLADAKKERMVDSAAAASKATTDLQTPTNASIAANKKAADDAVREATKQLTKDCQALARQAKENQDDAQAKLADAVATLNRQDASLATQIKQNSEQDAKNLKEMDDRITKEHNEMVEAIKKKHEETPEMMQEEHDALHDHIQGIRSQLQAAITTLDKDTSNRMSNIEETADKNSDSRSDGINQLGIELDKVEEALSRNIDETTDKLDDKLSTEIANRFKAQQSYDAKESQTRDVRTNHRPFGHRLPLCAPARMLCPKT